MAVPTTPVHRGLKVHWACGSSTITTGIGTFKLQSRDHSLNADTDMVQDATGYVVNKTYFNHTETATLDYVPTDTGSGGDLTPTIPALGNILTITDTVYTAIAGTNWMVDGVNTKSSNTSAMRVTLNLTRYGNITS